MEKAFGIAKIKDITPEMAEKALNDDFASLIASADCKADLPESFEYIGYTTFDGAKALIVKRLARFAALHKNWE